MVTVERWGSGPAQVHRRTDGEITTVHDVPAGADPVEYAEGLVGIYGGRLILGYADAGVGTDQIGGGDDEQVTVVVDAAGKTYVVRSSPEQQAAPVGTRSAGPGDPVLTIGEYVMRSTGTVHVAGRLSDTAAWVVSWLPERILGRNEAITAMTIAETIGSRDLEADRSARLLVASLAGELGLDFEDAHRRVTGFTSQGLNAFADRVVTGTTYDNEDRQDDGEQASEGEDCPTWCTRSDVHPVHLAFRTVGSALISLAQRPGAEPDVVVEQAVDEVMTTHQAWLLSLVLAKVEQAMTDTARCPSWCDQNESHSTPGLDVDHYGSSVTVPLAAHQDEFLGGLVVALCQRADEAEPEVHLSGPDETTANRLTLAEAELLHAALGETLAAARKAASCG